MSFIYPSGRSRTLGQTSLRSSKKLLNDLSINLYVKGRHRGIFLGVMDLQLGLESWWPWTCKDNYICLHTWKSMLSATVTWSSSISFLFYYSSLAALEPLVSNNNYPQEFSKSGCPPVLVYRFVLRVLNFFILLLNVAKNDVEFLVNSLYRMLFSNLLPLLTP